MARSGSLGAGRTPRSRPAGLYVDGGDAFQFEKGKLIERPTNQEVISKSHDTPIHRPCRDPHTARIPPITAGLSQATTYDLGHLSAIYVGKSVVPRKRWPAHERTIRGSINAGPPLEIPTWRWMPCTRTRSPHHVGHPWMHTWFALPAITTPRPSRRCEPSLRTSHGPTKGNERAAPARASHQRRDRARCQSPGRDPMASNPRRRRFKRTKRLGSRPGWRWRSSSTSPHRPAGMR